MQHLLPILLVFLLASTSAHAGQLDRSLFRGYDTAFVLHNSSTGQTESVDPELSARRLSPCSTFKIYNTLFGLELGLIKGADDPWYTWDGVQRDIEAWNHDLTLRESFRASAVPAYQVLARQIGPDRMKTFIDKIGYGTGDMASGIDTFWLPRPGKTSIMISANEQVSLLNKLLEGKLPFSKEHVAILKDIMLVKETCRGKLYGKTGSGMDEEGHWNLGWFVGFIESGGEVHIFACNITDGDNPSGLIAREIVIEVLNAKGLL
ncbi:penicillin binding protein transpeptidase domain-containing protein [Prosthecochloris sp. ZM]|uniref:penicillin-binding transpeptidase domain-containing protein n=1 Tax=Prosthecochloris sp. ZM TaxID=2283143 RepID=UPI000DF74D7D|nr:penicillin-binding transpeptidase domain-containing protein [Prosthecochloris sp. ZM]RDD31525.1 penicillin binding protein transpeptidase domain-containing protein [Prosthecochloris sp. ZM]